MSETPTPSITGSATPTRTPTPTPTSTTPFVQAIDITPDSRNLDIDDTAFFTAVATLSDGTTPNYTQKVTWSSSAPMVASISNETGMRGLTTGLMPGTAMIHAFDPVSGVHASEDSTVTVFGALESISLTPETSTVTIGTSEFYTATGHYAGGTTRNITQQVDYSTSNAMIAIAPNETGQKSRIDTVGIGTVTVFATDPTTQIAGDASLTVRTPVPTRTATPQPTNTPG